MKPQMMLPGASPRGGNRRNSSTSEAGPRAKSRTTTPIFGRKMGVGAGNLPFDCAQDRAKLDFGLKTGILRVESGHVVK